MPKSINRFSWELGGSLGHIIPMVPMARGLAEKGHKVYVALRQLTRAEGLGNADVRFANGRIV